MDGGCYPEFKVKMDSLNKVAFVNAMGGNYCCVASALQGGYIGGAEGVAVASVVYSFFTSLLFEGTYHLNFPVTMSQAISTNRPVLWALSVSSQAISRNNYLPVYNSGYTANGPATENYFYEAAAYILMSVTSGVTSGTPFPYAGVKKDGMTPLEALFHTRLTDAIQGMSRKEANKIVRRLLDEYEASLSSPEKGKTYPECFDLDKNEPLDEYRSLYERVKNQFAQLGIPLS